MRCFRTSGGDEQFDKLVLAIPAIVGGLPILFNLFSTLTILFLVIGFYLGFTAAIEDDHMKGALAAIGDVHAFVGRVAAA